MRSAIPSPTKPSANQSSSTSNPSMTPSSKFPILAQLPPAPNSLLSEDDSQTMHLEKLAALFLIVHLFLQFYNIYRMNVYNYEFFVIWFAIFVVATRFVLKWIGIEQSSRKKRKPKPKSNTANSQQTSSDEEERKRQKKPGAQATSASSQKQKSKTVFGLSVDQVSRLKGNSFVLLVVLLVMLLILVSISITLYKRHGTKFLLFSLVPVAIYPIVEYGSKIYTIITFSTTPTIERRSPTSSNNQDVKCFEIDAKEALKSLLFSTFECGYYASIFPLGFTQDYIYFEKLRCLTLIVFVFANTFVIFSMQLLHTSFFKLLYYSQTTGAWKQCQNFDESFDEVPMWSINGIPYNKNTIVKHNGKLYVAIGDKNTGVPGDKTDGILFVLFENPGRSYTYLITIQSVVTATQLILLLFQYDRCCWQVYVIQLLFNYYILFLCIELKKAFRGLQEMNQNAIVRHSNHHSAASSSLSSSTGGSTLQQNAKNSTTAAASVEHSAARSATNPEPDKTLK